MIQSYQQPCPRCEGESVGKILHCNECDNRGYITVSVNTSRYDADYFLRGKETGVSLYENYRWMPELTLPMVASMVSHLHIAPTDSILDFGCARGYVVRAFREMGYIAFGVDLSEWAITNCDPTVKDWVSCSNSFPFVPHDWVVTKDVLEHVTGVSDTIKALMRAAKVGVFAVVPLSKVDGGRYVVPSYEKDVTHIHRLTLPTWTSLFIQPGWSVECSYRVRGVKDNYWHPEFEMGNGFITARRMK